MKLTTGSKIWLWFALVLCCFTTIINLTAGRYLSVVLAVGSIIGLCIVIFAKKREGFYLLCICYVFSFFVGVVGGIQGGTGAAIAILMSLIGSLFVPGVTWLVLRNQLKRS